MTFPMMLISGGFKMSEAQVEELGMIFLMALAAGVGLYLFDSYILPRI